MADKRIRWRDLKKICNRFGIEIENREGSRVALTRPGAQPFTFDPHSENAEVSTFYIKAIRRRFGLTKQDGTTDTEFYAGKRSRKPRA